MAKPEWGSKRVCQSCGAKFYDMRRDPILCPKCGAAFDPETLLRSRRSRTAPTPEVAQPPKPRPAASGDKDEELDEEIDDDDDDDLIEDTSDLGDDDMDDVVEIDDEEDDS